MKNQIQTLPIIKLRNISYPERSLTLFISVFSNFHLSEIFSLRDTYPNTNINIFINENKLMFLYKNSIEFFSSLNTQKINIIFSNSVKSDMLFIDERISIPLVYINKTIHLNTGKVIETTLSDISTSSCNTLKGLFTHSDNSYISIVNNLTVLEINSIIDYINYSDIQLTSNDILQFSNFDNSTINLISVLSNIEEPLNYNDVGLLLTEGDKKPGAYKKYGENQSKTGELLELVSINSSVPKTVSLTPLGEALLNVNKEVFDNIIFFEILKCNLLKHLISLCKFNCQVNVKEICVPTISEKTYLRRRSNIKYLVNLLKAKNIESLNILLDKLSF
ncbi:hypothetical protein SAMN02745163_01317 [Clostridium cavendishii DSM 21758]|uniref:Uncharacterized protein n=1 Tax=Clostridium cavendishii DSM 21758 TaxID=1121302 RepID=A0A1M6GL67_9CLOT|nr:hypothetical protein [Clostridium cavendishii]SHJ10606.1 hypothetical protein SAMN02745163_01317 [Clostridium cavendishii DSM 21758]